MKWPSVCLFVIFCAVIAFSASLTSGSPYAQRQPVDGSSIGAVKAHTSYPEVKPILDSLRDDLLPVEFRAKTPVEREAIWPLWVRRHDTAIRSRLDRGDEDSVVNLLLFGVTFTRQPRTNIREMLSLIGDGRGEQFIHQHSVQARIDDMVAGMASPGPNERLQFARKTFARLGMNPAKAEGRVELRRSLETSVGRVIAEYETSFRESDQSSPYSGRGLSSDTSIYPNFAIEVALEAIKAGQLLETFGVRRVAIIGPGLDFTDKREGYDFYSPQTLQPFAVIDSLMRLALAHPDALRVTTFDVSPRINDHLNAARRRARDGGAAYTLVLPRDTELPWTPELAAYWRRFGNRIGMQTRAAAPPRSAGAVHVRAVRVRPDVMTSVTPLDLNIVVERLDSLREEERFDLIIATNVFLYYDAFEQSIALLNVSQLLRSGGLLLSNDPVAVLPVIHMNRVGSTDLQYTALPNSRDQLVWYRRQ